MRQQHQHRGANAQAGLSLIGLLFWAIVIGFMSMVAIKTFPSVNEYLTIQRAVSKLAREGPSTVQEIRAAFERQKEIEYSIKSIGGKDLDISKENDKVVIRFQYDSEVELISPVYLLIKYEGRSK
jgi:hypothetical protein